MFDLYIGSWFVSSLLSIYTWTKLACFCPFLVASRLPPSKLQLFFLGLGEACLLIMQRGSVVHKYVTSNSSFLVAFQQSCSHLSPSLCIQAFPLSLFSLVVAHYEICVKNLVVISLIHLYDWSSYFCSIACWVDSWYCQFGPCFSTLSRPLLDGFNFWLTTGFPKKYPFPNFCCNAFSVVSWYQRP